MLIKNNTSEQESIHCEVTASPSGMAKEDNVEEIL